jgi:hypothetical protein
MSLPRRETPDQVWGLFGCGKGLLGECGGVRGVPIANPPLFDSLALPARVQPHPCKPFQSIRLITRFTVDTLTDRAPKGEIGSIHN